MSERPEDSPNYLHIRPRRGDGVRRLNRVPLMIAGFMLLLIFGAVIYSYQMRLAELRRRASETATQPEPVNLPELFPNAPFGGAIERLQPASIPGALPRLQPAEAPTQPPKEEPVETPAKDEDWERYMQLREQLDAARRQRLAQAISAPTQLRSPRPPARRNTERSQPDAAPQNSPSGQIAALYSAEALRQRALLAAEGGEQLEDVNRAAEKRAFLTDREAQSLSEHYLPYGREAPRSPYEIKAGTVIPAVLVSGINSDLPGQIIGLVKENVYDTATGRYILIPQGAKLIGTYDNAVTTGQDRVLIAWTRIIYPDASSVDLGKMPGTDQSGLAGFHDQVDNHYWQAFGSAILLSIFSAGVQISQGNGDDGDDGQSAQQTIAAGLGQQLGQLGQEVARRNTRIQPTLKIRPGYQFTVTVTKDIIIKPWRES